MKMFDQMYNYRFVSNHLIPIEWHMPMNHFNRAIVKCLLHMLIMLSFVDVASLHLFALLLLLSRIFHVIVESQHQMGVAVWCANYGHNHTAIWYDADGHALWHVQVVVFSLSTLTRNRCLSSFMRSPFHLIFFPTIWISISFQFASLLTFTLLKPIAFRALFIGVRPRFFFLFWQMNKVK